MMTYAYDKGIMKENSIVYKDLFDTKPVSYTHLDVYKRQRTGNRRHLSGCRKRIKLFADYQIGRAHV